MFDPGEGARLFGVPPGVDFPAALIAGLRARLEGQPPEAMARIDLVVNTRRMARRLREIFDAGPPGFLPRIHLLTGLDALCPGAGLPRPVSPLRRRLELARLVSPLLDAYDGMAPRAALYALSDSLATLIDEMQGEGVSAETIAALDVTDQSGHWERAKAFLGIAHAYLSGLGEAPDAEARQRQLVTRIAAHWAAHPPAHPVILAGSTGSRGTTALLMQAVAKLPQGALVLPGFDFEMPDHIWRSLQAEQPPEDHPQYRFFDLMRSLEVTRDKVADWAGIAPPSRPRNALVSLSLRPAPVTDTWLAEGPRLPDIPGATRALTLIEAQTPRIEALAIAMRLRKAVQEGRTAALITPDRMLTRQVTSALDRWNILPDDSAGTPLQLTPPGRFLRHVAALLARPLDAEALLTLLKHPLTHSGAGRNEHQLNTQRLEGRIRYDGLPYPDQVGLERLGARISEGSEQAAEIQNWIGWVAESFCRRQVRGVLPLTDWVTRLRDLAEVIAAGAPGDPGHGLWQKAAGREALAVMETLAREAPHGGEITSRDFADLLGALLSAEEVRDRDAPHPRVMIWGTLEARVQGADLVILGGLNEGTWPEAPPPDPWLNRRMRFQAGLLLPERRIGLSAHDYQQAIAAPEVWLTRAIRSDEAETVPSRWISRLTNLLDGLPGETGKTALKEMRQRGRGWLEQVTALEACERIAPAPRPAPRPPVAARPRRLSVTEIQRLIRDPYAIYARHCLGLRPVNALVQSPDAPVRGTLLHQILERFVRDVQDDPALLGRDHMLRITDAILTEAAPWPAARLMWRARIERVADWFVAREAERLQTASPVVFEDEATGSHEFTDIGFTLVGKADRIDRNRHGEALIYDYKTGSPPSRQQQRHFDKQLLLEAAMIEEGGFRALGAAPVARATYIGLGANPVEVAAPLDEEPPADVLAGLHHLLSAYLDPEQGFASRRFVTTESFAGDYDQLARFGEWDGTVAPTPEDLE